MATKTSKSGLPVENASCSTMAKEKAGLGVSVGIGVLVGPGVAVGVGIGVSVGKSVGVTSVGVEGIGVGDSVSAGNGVSVGNKVGVGVSVSTKGTIVCGCDDIELSVGVRPPPAT